MFTDRSVSIIDKASENVCYSFGKIAEDASAFSFSPDGEKFLVSTKECVYLYWLLTGGCNKLVVPKYFIAQFSPDGSRIIAPSEKPETAQIMSVTKKASCLLEGEKEIVSARFSPKGTYAITIYCDGTVGVWDATSGKLKGMLGQEGVCVKGLDCSFDENYLATLSGNVVRIWDIATSKEVHRLVHNYDDGKGEVHFVRFISHNGQFLISLWENKDFEQRLLKWDLSPLVAPVEEVAFAAFKKWSSLTHCSRLISLGKSAYGSYVVKNLNGRFDSDYPAIPIKNQKFRLGDYCLPKQHAVGWDV